MRTHKSKFHASMSGRALQRQIDELWAVLEGHGLEEPALAKERLASAWKSEPEGVRNGT